MSQQYIYQIVDLTKKYGPKEVQPLEPDEMEMLLAEQARVQDKIELLNLWELDRQIEIAMDAMNLPPGDAEVTKLSGGDKYSLPSRVPGQSRCMPGIVSQTCPIESTGFPDS